MKAEIVDPLDGRAMGRAFSGDVFAAQQRLRAHLLDRPAIRYAPARDLAAHMLLYLNDLPACWALATHWLRAELQCQRVDTGFGVRREKDYFPGFAEALDADYDVPSFAGSAVDNRDPAMQSMWLDPRPLVFADIKQDRRISMRLRQRISGARTKSKMAWALRTGAGSYGLICADWTEHKVPSDGTIYDCFEQTVTDVLGPIIAVAKAIANHNGTLLRDAGAGLLGPGPSDVPSLTPSEMDVARLVAQGMSYKEIALRRGRSFSTIDHQLRSIRQKTGATSTAALISLLAKTDLSGR